MALFKDGNLVLAGDVGGTKTNLGLFQVGKMRPSPRVMETYSSKDAPDLEHIISRFLDKLKTKIASACFGVAGPVQGGRSKTTNLPWTISENSIKKRFKWNHVKLINDLTATAYAIPLLTNTELHALNEAKGAKGQNLGLIAPGTGLGMALLIWVEDRYIPVASEGGHADFGPNDLMEAELWAYLYERWDHVSVERVLSGSGLFNIYVWLRDSGRHIEPSWLADKIKATDPARAIGEAAMEKKDPLCEEALDIFVSLFGAVAGNLALTGMTTGGVYLGGGIPPKILPKLEEDTFIQAFTNKGRFKNLMEKIPVRVILNDRAALLGAAHCAFEMQKTRRSKSS
ncbi:MAG: glucokinase [Desulfobacteraceae bacterium]